jgi:hypothetical protein
MLLKRCQHLLQLHPGEEGAGRRLQGGVKQKSEGKGTKGAGAGSSEGSCRKRFVHAGLVGLVEVDPLCGRQTNNTATTG